MSGSSYIQGVLPGLEIGNCRRTLDVCLLFAILLGKTKLQTYNQFFLNLSHTLTGH